MENFLLYLKIIPALISVITAVEEAIPQSGAGQAKLEMIKNLMTQAYSGITSIWPMVETAIGAIVKTMNAIGIFKSNATPVAK